MDKPVLARLQKVMQLREEVETLSTGGPFVPEADWTDSGTHLTLVADVPGRCEPGTGEVNWPFVARALAESGYQGVVAMEAFASGAKRPVRDWPHA